MAELVDATDLKSVGRKAVRVRVPLPVPDFRNLLCEESNACTGQLFYGYNSPDKAPV